jgi:cell division protein FtsI/penicillin-binding protein 2
MNAFGLGVRLGLDLPSEDKGNIPDTARYNREYRGQWNSCTNLTLGIGQDMMTATRFNWQMLCVSLLTGGIIIYHILFKR